MQELIKQVEFASLEAFVAGQNNYWAHFNKGNDWGETRRARPHFTRFQQAHPELEEKTTNTVLAAKGVKKNMPFELLFETYPLMAQYVYATDEDAVNYCQPDMYLIS